jgi:ribose transport system permease protein
MLLGFLVVLCALFAVLQGDFATGANVQNLLRQASVLGLLAVGQLFVIIVGGLDISVGAQVSLLAMIAVKLSTGIGVLEAFVVTVLIAAAFGLVNGVVIAYLRVSPIIATLGTWQVLFGVALLWSQGLPFRPSSPSFSVLGNDNVWFLAAPTCLMIVAGLAAWGILNRTRVGRYIYAVGGNAEAARLSGIDVRLYTIAAYVLCSVFTALGTLALVSRTQSADALLGQSLNIEVIAAVFIGGAAWAGGAGTVLGAVLGALVLRTLQNGFNLAGISTELQVVITGLLIIASVALYGFRRHGRKVRRAR